MVAHHLLAGASEAFLSIDLGTTVCKAAVYSVDGRLLGESAQEYSLVNLGDGFTEQDADQWWLLSQATARAALERAGGGQRVRAVGISSQGISFVPVGEDGRPLRPALSWLDTRAVAEAEWIRAAVGDAALFHITGKRAGAVYVLPKLLWLKRHQPEVWRRTHKYLMAHDYLLFRLCGEMVTDYSLAGGSLLLDLRQLCWSQALLDQFDIDEDTLPALAWAGSAAGRLNETVAEALGCSKEAVVAVGGQDQKCAAFGAGLRTGQVAVSLGTAAAISCLVSEPVLDHERRIPAFPFLGPGQWVLEGVVGAAGAALRWARDVLFSGRSYAELDALAAQSPVGANGVCFYPHLAGATSPIWCSVARGRLAGLHLATSAGDVARSIMEGVAYQIRANVEIIQSLAPVSADEVVLFGGGARSHLWTEILSQVLARPVVVPGIIDAASWGACLLAAQAVGQYGRTQDRTPPGGLRYRSEPQQAAVEHYEAAYQRYLAGEQTAGAVI
jgi:xylulokinase